MPDTHALLGRLLETCSDRLSEADLEEIYDLMQGYEPYNGDPPEEVIERDMAHARCGNCDLAFPTMSMPSELGKAAQSAMRHAACPRCYSNTRIFLGN